jgi:DNA polymerase (family 10)
VDNAAVAQIFQDLADLLELKGENRFKVKAYERAARAIEDLPVDLAQVMSEGRLREIPGIGEAIEKKIYELLTTGHLELHDRLRSEFPDDIRGLMDVPGVGPRIAARAHQELGVSTVDDLEKAIVEGRFASLPGLGEKTADNILRQLRRHRYKDVRIPLGTAQPLVDEIVSALSQQPGVRHLQPAGSLRRAKETVGDIDIMGTADEPARIVEAFVHLPMVEEVLAKGPTRASVIAANGIQVDLRMVDHNSYGSLLQHFTGSKEHNVMLREIALHRGLSLSEYGIAVVDTGEVEKFADEAAFYERLGMQFIPPELREAQGEIEAAQKRKLPELVDMGDIRGDVHVHTDWSDGRDSIEAMALAAHRRGYQYLAITDHSAGRGIAHGLSVERLREQIAEIREVNARLRGIRLLAGIEVDIRADGALDYPDDVLDELDMVVAAVHSSMQQDSEKMTRRVIRAVENPRVHVLAHPTCRLIGMREPVEIDLEEVFRASARTNTALEINAMPDRLDLGDTQARRAREFGVRLVIGTDSHSVDHLGVMRYGVGVARRGWCRASDVLNTWPVDEFLSWLKRK